MPLIKNIILLALTSLLLSACHSTKNSAKWPENLPARSIFVDAHQEQAQAGTNNSSIEAHLKWIKRFYRGLSIYPGWNDMTKLVLDSMSEYSEADQKDAKKRLAKLGQKIAIEWAQANDKRNIDSANINVWGNALRTSVKRDEQITFLTRVDRDVDELIIRELDMRAITYDRYYPTEEIDDF